jgi:phenylacetate-coenzyme A ligase PaaK-like adenylate-forming protein
VFDSGVRQLRMAMGMVWGWRLDARNVARMVEDAVATIAEFGEPGADVETLYDGPIADPEAQRHFATRALRRTAGRLAEQSPFYARRFEAAGVRPDRLDIEGLGEIPVTVKSDLTARPEEFRCADVERHLSTRTTGTTGRPTEIWLSRYEMELWPAMGALAAVLRQELRPSDIVQVSMSSRATASVELNVATCHLVGAGCRVLGIVPPDEALDSMAGDSGATLLTTWPSYLAELVVAARRRGMGPNDFRLRRVQASSEVLSPSLARAAQETFGVPAVGDLFGMTEVIPVTGRTCGQGHLHLDINQGLVELLDLETGAPAEPGALATLVITPFFPYRECMPVFRYDTRDVVRRLPEERLTCEVAGLPGTSPILGKADHLMRLGSGSVVTPRQLVEAIEALPTEPWPARFRASVHNGQIKLTLPEAAIDGFGDAAAHGHFADHGLDVDLTVVPNEEATALRPLRSDLHETTFAARPTLIGA